MVNRFRSLWLLRCSCQKEKVLTERCFQCQDKCKFSTARENKHFGLRYVLLLANGVVQMPCLKPNPWEMIKLDSKFTICNHWEFNRPPPKTMTPWVVLYYAMLIYFSQFGGM